MREALADRDFNEAGGTSRRRRSREYHSSWHTGDSTYEPALVSEAITLSAIERKESRAATSARTIPKSRRVRHLQHRRQAGGRRLDAGVARTLPPVPDHLKQAIEGAEILKEPGNVFEFWRRSWVARRLQDYTTGVSDGMVVLDAVHRIQAEQAPTSRSAGTARRASAGRAPRKSTGVRG